MPYRVSQYQEEIVSEFKVAPIEATPTGGLGTMASIWQGATAPTGGRQCDQSTDGARFSVSATDVWRVGRMKIASSPGNLFLYDRLCDQSGLVANITTSQPVTLPALPRYAGGFLVEAFLEVIATFTGSPAASLTVNYTDSNGNPAVGVTPLSGTVGSVVKRLIPLAAAVGGKGFRTVSSVQLDNAYTTAGNLGIVLAKRIAMLPQATTNVGTVMPPNNEISAFRGGLPKIQPNACLWLVGLGHTTTVGGAMLEYSFLKTQ